MMLALKCWSVDKNCTTVPLWRCFSLFTAWHGAKRWRAELHQALPDATWCCWGGQAAAHSTRLLWSLWQHVDAGAANACLSWDCNQSHLLGVLISAYNNIGPTWLCKDRPRCLILSPFFLKSWSNWCPNRLQWDCIFWSAADSPPSHQDPRHQPTSLLSWQCFTGCQPLPGSCSCTAVLLCEVAVGY